MNKDKFVLQDGFGNKMDAEFVIRFNLNENEYIVYNILNDDNYKDVYVGRFIHDDYGNESIISISNCVVEEKIFSIIDKIIYKVR